MNKSSMVESLVSYYSGGNKAMFASKLGVSPQTINGWIKRNTFDGELIYSKCECVSADWILSGEGEMIREQQNVNIENNSEKVEFFKKEIERLKSLVNISSNNSEKILNVWMKFMEVTSEMQALYKETKNLL